MRRVNGRDWMAVSIRKRLEYLIGAYGPAVGRHLMRDQLWIGPHRNGEKVAYLTFDDGPTPDLTPLLLQTLRDFNTRATFFLLGRQTEAYPTLAKDIKDQGHAVGVHGHSHLDAWRTEADLIYADLTRSLELTSTVLQERPRLYRPPFGRSTARTRNIARDLGLRLVMWGIMPGDYLPGANHRQLAARVVRRLYPGAIVVMHDSANPNVRSHTVPALREILERSSAEGWAFRTLDES